MKKLTTLLLALILLLSLSCVAFADALPASEPDETNMFGVDKNINMETLDQYLGRDDVVYRDVRMLFDPADYAAIGGNADLASTVEGFRIVPYPYLATLSALPVDGAYAGDTLYTLTWNEDGSIATAEPNYEESLLVLEDLFPKDKAIFLMCGGGASASRRIRSNDEESESDSLPALRGRALYLCLLHPGLCRTGHHPLHPVRQRRYTDGSGRGDSV